MPQFQTFVFLFCSCCFFGGIEKLSHQIAHFCRTRFTNRFAVASSTKIEFSIILSNSLVCTLKIFRFSLADLSAALFIELVECLVVIPKGLHNEAILERERKIPRQDG